MVRVIEISSKFWSHLGKILSFVLCIIMIIIFMRSDIFILIMNGQFSDIAQSSSVWVLLFMTLVLMIIQNLFTIVPLVLLVTFNLVLFGFTYGYLWSITTSIVGAIVCFFAVRFWFQSFFLAKVNPHVKARIERNGFVYVLIARIFPFVPTSLINIASGISTIQFRHFLLSTLIGNTIYIFGLVLIIQGIMSLRVEKYIYIIIASLLVLYFIYYMMRRYHARK